MLLGVTGSRGSGKDTLATGLDAQIVKMADTLKNMLRTMYREAGLEEEEIERKIEGDLKEEPCEVLGGASPRRAMQTLGTEWAKMVDPTHTIWSRIWFVKALKLLEEGQPVVCTDIRFRHEAEAVRALGGYLARVNRPDQVVHDLHPSETEMRGLDVDFTISNHGTPAQLQEKAQNLVKEITS